MNGSGEEIEASIPAVVAVAKQVSVFPNPAHGIVNFEFKSTEQQSSIIQITNMYGATVQEISINDGVPARWNTQTNANGIYFYHLLLDGEVVETGRILLAR